MKYRYTLESSRFAQQQGRHQKYPCPQCGRRTLVRYIDTWTAHYIADDVGRCDREVNCGYHYRPQDYLNTHPSEERQPFSSLPPLDQPRPLKVGYIPGQFITFNEKMVGTDNLFKFLMRFFNVEEIREEWRKYNVLPSKRWRWKGGLSTAYPQIDQDGRCRQVKVIAYDPITGHRLKEQDPAIFTMKNGSQIEDRINSKVWFAGSSLTDSSLQQVLFGTHLIEASSVVRVVESEKTALICALCASKLVDGVWVATGGMYGCGWKSDAIVNTLQGHKVMLYPDCDAYPQWTKIAEGMANNGIDISVSPFLEEHCSLEEKAQGFDLADYIIKDLQTKKF